MLNCGQSCPGTKTGVVYLKPMAMLKKGDILPACNHAVRRRIIKLLRQGRYQSEYRVKACDEKSTKNTAWNATLYGAPYTLIEVEPEDGRSEGSQGEGSSAAR